MNVNAQDCTIMIVPDADNATGHEKGIWRKEILEGNLMLTLELDGRPYFSIRYPGDASDMPSDNFLKELTDQWSVHFSPNNYSFVAALVCRVGILEEQLQFLTDTLLEAEIEVKGNNNGQVCTPEASEEQELSNLAWPPEENDVEGTG